MCRVRKTKSRTISSCNSVECKGLWTLQLECYNDSIPMVLAGCRAKLNHLLLPVGWYGVEHTCVARGCGDSVTT
jgi:hypothetical protein